MNSKLLILFFVIQILILSCHKQISIATRIENSSVIVVNAVVNASSIATDFSSEPVQWYNNAETVGFASYYEYAIRSGVVPVMVSQSTDTLHKIFNGALHFQPHKIYSLFLAGEIDQSGQSTADTLLTIDNPPYHGVSDSTDGIRFINLSPGSNSISVDIQGEVNGSEVSGLAYRAITSFKTYLATSNVSQYNFEFRDSATGNLLATWSYGVTPYQNVTIGLCGSPTNNNFPQQSFQVNNF
jgi:hypothetical protein